MLTLEAKGQFDLHFGVSTDLRGRRVPFLELSNSSLTVSRNLIAEEIEAIRDWCNGVLSAPAETSASFATHNKFLVNGER